MKIHRDRLGTQNKRPDINSSSSGKKYNSVSIDTRDRLSISKDNKDKTGIIETRFAHLRSKLKTAIKDSADANEKQDIEVGQVTGNLQESEKDVSITIPFDKHIEQACDYILEKTESQYPGFKSNDMGKSRKAHQIRSHMKDFVEFVKEKQKGDLASLPEKERKDMISEATGFIADKIGDEYGMAPHMRRNAIFMSPIRSNVGDYLDFLNKKNMVISSDEKGELTVTKYLSRESAMNALTGMDKNSQVDDKSQKSITKMGSWVVIGGVKLPVNEK
ncbi:MAG: hypothetical protein K8T10_19395 [Candidatus Eremiobacteraeota bacterium]|nr:hypothetical protein [Candidatus Eremiobacteraeota bacterium]